MTRLTEQDIEHLTQQLQQLDAELTALCGMPLRELALTASGLAAADMRSLRIGVVPITAGRGVIGGFSDSVCGILNHIGADAFVTDGTDVEGIYQSMRQADCGMYADDNRYLSVRYGNGTVSDNGDATGRGFAAALLAVAGSLDGETVLVTGAGPVGRAAANWLTAHGAQVVVCDVDPDKLRDLPYDTISSLDGRQFRYVLDATPAADVIHAGHITEDAVVAAPGMPLGIAEDAVEKLRRGGTLIHNPLELGTAVMYTDLLL
ncbi:MAG: 3-methylornithyl-N6-L-lysine dehydrogenase PylD [Butyricicoccus sp.]